MGKKYTKDQLIILLREYVNSNNRIPKISDFKNKNNLPTYDMYRKTFGKDYLKTLEMCGIELSEEDKDKIFIGFQLAKHYSKEEIISKILEKSRFLNRELLYNDFSNPKYGEIGIKTIKKHFGSFNKMKEELNLEITQIDMVNRHKTKKEMLDDMKNFINELGRLPYNREINANKNMLGSLSYNKYFGSVNKVFELLGYKPNKKCISLHLSNEEIKQLYYDFIIEDMNGIVPSFDFCKTIYKLPSPRTVLRRFKCSWNDFVKSLGFEPNDKIARGEICYAKDGTQCLSIAESIIHNYLLEKINVKIEKEIMYRDVIANESLHELCGLKRFDWLIKYNNVEYIVEYFGFIQNAEYKQRHDLKLDVIKKANLEDKLIAIYPKDLSKLDEVFSFLK